MKIRLLSPLAISAITLIGSHNVIAQGMAVNTSGAAANSSAILDASSTTQGVLIPRMTLTSVNAIPSPATGLLVYCTNCGAGGFYYYSGTAWTALSGGSPTGAAGGDLTGTYPNPALAANSVNTTQIIANAVTNAKVGSGAATSDKVLRADGSGNSSWLTPFSLTTTGSGAATYSSGTLNIPTPSAGVTSITAGTGLSGGTITSTGTISMPNVGTANTYGDASHIPVITTDAQGRVSGVTSTAISSSHDYIISNIMTGVNNTVSTQWGAVAGTGSISTTSAPYPGNGTYQGETIFPTNFTVDGFYVHGVTRVVTGTNVGYNITVELYDNGVATGVSATTTIPNALGDGTNGTWSGSYSMTAGHIYYYQINCAATGANAAYLCVSLHGH